MHQAVSKTALLFASIFVIGKSILTGTHHTHTDRQCKDIVLNLTAYLRIGEI